MVGVMKSKKVEPNGYSLIEMMIVMLLLVLFGLGIFMLAATSSTTYQKLVEDKETDGELRVASSYLMTKIRQNDRMGAIRIEKSAINSEDALVIEETLGNEVYETWIYVSDGVLREATVLKENTPNDDVSFEVAKVDDVRFGLQDQSILITIEKNLETVTDLTVTLKSKVTINE
jgi:type II secretory pathway component PulJ